jgi:hypothetical protein
VSYPEGGRGNGLRRAPQGAPRPAAWLGAAALACAAAGFAAQPASAQNFGRNRVQYDHRDFHVLATPHFQVHYYPVAEVAIQDAARMAERWYERLARFFQHDFIESPKPLIFYADHADLQQTNTLHGFIREATGGVTESLREQVIMPLVGSYAATDHVLGHEMVHAFQYDMARAQGREAVAGLVGVPLWLLEGMAEYLSVGPEDPHTAMWLRDALLRDRLPTIRQIVTRESPYFPYRFGQALWVYIGGTYGDPTVATLFRRTLRLDFETAVGQVLGRGTDALSLEWRRQVEAAYLPLMEGRQDPGDVGTPILSPASGSGALNVGPALSPDGRTVAFLSERDVLSIDLLLADARTGRVIRRLASAASDMHFDALAWTGTSGTFSPDGTLFAYVVFSGGSQQLAVAATADGRIVRRLDTPGIGSIASPAWSPDGGQIAFTGTVGGISDLFVYDLFTDQVRQLTRDRHADDHPAWSPDGGTLAFATDRGPETDFGRLVYSERRLALLDVATGDLQVLELFGDVRHSNPQFSPDGRSLYFLSDRDGFSDVYRLELATSRTERITRLKTGVSGVTSHAPALSVASRTGELAMSVFTDFGFHIHMLEAEPEGAPVTVTAAASFDEYAGRRLPPLQSGRQSRVADYLGDPDLGLEPAERFLVENATRYRPSLTLDRWGQPFLNASADRWGTYIGSSASAYFSDMLDNHHVGVAIRPAMSLPDVGAEFFYGNLVRRWNWLVAASHTPSRLVNHKFESDDGRIYLRALHLRVLESRLRGQVAFPFSTTRRVELGAGLSHIGFHLWEERFFLDRSLAFFTGETERVTHEVRCSDLSAAERALGTTPCEPDPLNLAHVSVGWVGDDSFFGLTSPIRGGRFRVGLEATVGAESFVTAVADWRRYYAPWQNLTVAARGSTRAATGASKTWRPFSPGSWVRSLSSADTPWRASSPSSALLRPWIRSAYPCHHDRRKRPAPPLPASSGTGWPWRTWSCACRCWASSTSASSPSRGSPPSWWSSATPAWPGTGTTPPPWRSAAPPWSACPCSARASRRASTWPAFSSSRHTTPTPSSGPCGDRTGASTSRGGGEGRGRPCAPRSPQEPGRCRWWVSPPAPMAVGVRRPELRGGSWLRAPHRGCPAAGGEGLFVPPAQRAREPAALGWHGPAEEFAHPREVLVGLVAEVRRAVRGILHAREGGVAPRREGEALEAELAGQLDEERLATRLRDQLPAVQHEGVGRETPEGLEFLLHADGPPRASGRQPYQVDRRRGHAHAVLEAAAEHVEQQRALALGEREESAERGCGRAHSAAYHWDTDHRAGRDGRDVSLLRHVGLEPRAAPAPLPHRLQGQRDPGLPNAGPSPAARAVGGVLARSLVHGEPQPAAVDERVLGGRPQRKVRSLGEGAVLARGENQECRKQYRTREAHERSRFEGPGSPEYDTEVPRTRPNRTPPSSATPTRARATSCSTHERCYR